MNKRIYKENWLKLLIYCREGAQDLLQLWQIKNSTILVQGEALVRAADAKLAALKTKLVENDENKKEIIDTHEFWTLYLVFLKIL